jgi:CRP-like cAMP-binding protein
MPAGQREEVEKVLTTHGWLAEQPPGLQQEILDRGHLRWFPSGTLLVRPGDPPSGLYAVIVGRIKLVHYLPDGREVLLWPAEPGFWFGIRNLFARETVRYAALAATDARLFYLPQSAFDDILARKPRYAVNFAHIMSHNFLLALRLIAEVLSQPTTTRVAHLLALLSETAGTDEQGRYEVRLSQQDLAGMVGLSRVTANKMLQTLQDEGLISLRYGRIVVPDRGKLARYPIP